MKFIIFNIWFEEKNRGKKEQVITKLQGTDRLEMC